MHAGSTASATVALQTRPRTASKTKVGADARGGNGQSIDCGRIGHDGGGGGGSSVVDEAWRRGWC